MTMQNNDSDGASAPSANFWEPHQYSHTVKRVDNANKLCNDLISFIQERSEIEKNYANDLRRFSNRLETFLKQGLEYGTGANLVSGLSKEAQDSAELHSNIAVGLLNPVQQGIKTWQKENFHKSTISSSIKEVKNFDSEFENAQKPWHKAYKHVKKCQKDYFNACKAVRSLQVHVQNAKNEPFGTSEQNAQRAKNLRKMEDRLRKATAEEDKTRTAYQESISALNAATPQYMEDMTQVFNKAQAFERKRLEFFKEQLLSMQEVLDISSKPTLRPIFSEMRDTIMKVDPEADLKKFSLLHGVDMPTNFPTFQEYSPELSALGKKGKSAVADGNTGVTLTSMKMISSPERPTAPETGSTSSPAHAPIGFSVNGGAAYPGATQPSGENVAPYPDLVDDGRPGVPIRALYDYVGVEADELSFNTGDLFEKLEDEDEQGWCKGRKDGRVGLYPANYVQVL